MRRKEKYWICKERKKFANQFDFTQKEKDIKDKTIETAKNIKKDAKAWGLKQFKNPWNKNPYRDNTCK